MSCLRDIEEVADGTKIVWASAPPIFPFKARDFCTLVHFRQMRDGTVVVLNRYMHACERMCEWKCMGGAVRIGKLYVYLASLWSSERRIIRWSRLLANMSGLRLYSVRLSIHTANPSTPLTSL